MLLFVNSPYTILAAHPNCSQWTEQIITKHFGFIIHSRFTKFQNFNSTVSASCPDKPQVDMGIGVFSHNLR